MSQKYSKQFATCVIMPCGTSISESISFTGRGINMGSREACSTAPQINASLHLERAASGICPSQDACRKGKGRCRPRRRVSHGQRASSGNTRSCRRTDRPSTARTAYGLRASRALVARLRDQRFASPATCAASPAAPRCRQYLDRSRRRSAP
jgi:hypothetical protein